MISPEYLCRRVRLNVLRHYSYHKRYPHKARRLDTRYDKPGGCTYEYRYACVNQLKKHIPAIKVTPTKPRGWIHDMISPEAARMRVNMYMQIYNECEKDGKGRNRVAHIKTRLYSILSAKELRKEATRKWKQGKKTQKKKTKRTLVFRRTDNKN